MNQVEFQKDAQRYFNEASDRLRRRASPTLLTLAPGFSVSWFRSTGESLWQAVLKPKDWVREKFGLYYEYLLVANHFANDLHVDSLNVEVDSRIGARLDRQLRFVASDAPGASEITASWARDQQLSVVLLTTDVERDVSPESNRAALEGILRTALRIRDRFDDSEPVRTPGEFYGREAVVNDIIRRLMNGQPVGLMGLRKIGKSSVLRRVEDRLLGTDTKLALTAFVTCNGSEVKGSHWGYLAQMIIRQWSASLQRKAGYLERPLNLVKVKSLQEVMARGDKLANPGEVARAMGRDFDKLYKAAAQLAGTPDGVRFVAFLDEADHLNPEAPDAEMWRDGFFEFWNTIQSIKRDHQYPRSLCWMLGGVNPSILENGSLRELPNPLYETKVEFLKPMNVLEASEMLNGLGLPMGISFDDAAVSAIVKFTGGHPLSLRKAGSLVHRGFPSHLNEFIVSGAEVRRILGKNQPTFLNHIEWVLLHLKNIAPDEYALLRDICVRGVRAYEEDWQDREFRDVFARHLEEFGLVTFENDLLRVAVELVVDVFQKKASIGIGTQKGRLRDAVDALEQAIRFRLRNDLQYPTVPDKATIDGEGGGGEFGEDFDGHHRTVDSVVDLVANSIPKDAKGRAKTREELRQYGRTKGLAAMFEALNWDDYLLLIDKNFTGLRLKGALPRREQFVADLRETVKTAHVVRHNNDTELKMLLNQRGFESCMRTFLEARAYFSD